MPPLRLLLLLLLWPPPSRCCQTSTYTECQGAPFVPGHNLVGEGFDVVQLQTTGGTVVDVKTYMSGGVRGNCTVCHNGLLNQTQKLPVSVLDWRIKVQCKQSLSSKTFDSTQSVMKETSDSLSASWKVGLGLPGIGGLSVGGSHSKSSTFAQSHSKSDKFSFMTHDLKCSYYTFRLHTRPPLSKEFKESLSNLPTTFHHKNTSAFRQFISVYGTHFIRRVHLGGKVHSMTAVRTCQAAMSKLSTRTISNCLSVEASAVIKGVQVSAATEFCKAQGKKLQNGHSFSASFSDRIEEVLGGDSSVGDMLFNSQGHAAYQKWLQSLRTLPGVVDYNISPLHLLVTDNPTLRSSLRAAIRDYVMSNARPLKCPSGCTTGIQSATCSCKCHGHSLVNADCCPTETGIARLNVTVLKAEGLWGDYFSKTDGYVKVFYSKQSATTHVIWNNDFPVWNYQVRFGTVNLNSRIPVQIEVWDRDNRWDDDLLGKASLIPTAGRVDKRFNLKHGTVTIRTQAACGPSLQGVLCEQYRPSPNEELSGYREVLTRGPDRDQDQGSGDGPEENSVKYNADV